MRCIATGVCSCVPPGGLAHRQFCMVGLQLWRTRLRASTQSCPSVQGVQLDECRNCAHPVPYRCMRMCACKDTYARTCQIMGTAAITNPYFCMQKEAVACACMTCSGPLAGLQTPLTEGHSIGGASCSHALMSPASVCHKSHACHIHIRCFESRTCSRLVK